VVDRLGVLLADENLEAISGTLQNIEKLTAVLSDRSAGVDTVLAGAAQMTVEIRKTSVEVRQLASDLRQATDRLDQRVDGVSGDLVGTLTELRGAASSLAGAAGQLQRVMGQLEQPVDDFASTGLYEFTQLIGETRVLVAALSRITKEFERDPAGFLIGRSSRGYRPK
jgi:phospholipid/cholesterol/gamma-HCH transport system substrate-binding protein